MMSIDWQRKIKVQSALAITKTGEQVRSQLGSGMSIQQVLENTYTKRIKEAGMKQEDLLAKRLE